MPFLSGRAAGFWFPSKHPPKRVPATKKDIPMCGCFNCNLASRQGGILRLGESTAVRANLDQSMVLFWFSLLRYPSWLPSLNIASGQWAG